MSDRTKFLLPRKIKGKDYLYFRHAALPKLVSLPVDQNSSDFRRDYDACMRKVKAALAPAQKPAAPAPLPVGTRVSFLPDTLGAAINRYRHSTNFAKLAASTKRNYIIAMKELTARLGTGKIADLDTDAIDAPTEETAKLYGTSKADAHKFMISNVWQFVRKYPEFNLKGKSNPTMEAEKRYSVKQKHRPWPVAVQQAFMAAAPEHLKLAKLLLHFSAQRGGDCVKMEWADFDGVGLVVRPEKTDGEVEAVADYYKCPKPLLDALNKAPRVAKTILVSAWNMPYQNSNVLSAAIRRELVRLGFAKKGQRTFVMHGLRKTAASDVGSLGVGAAGVKAVGGWKTDEEANYYAADADKRRINAMVVDAWDAELERQAAESAARAGAERGEAAAAINTRRAQMRNVKT